MRRPQLEHLIRAASAITGAQELMIIGSQAILGQFPNPPEDSLESHWTRSDLPFPIQLRALSYLTGEIPAEGDKSYERYIRKEIE